ncbi:hypothetical protein PVK06_027501 [Gossypium arboreum]|uniref:RNase H type-1 domain-containing protein n=1 Tax=Gossypium arboreum TaxID=29729 RepID=A0ABR0P3T5_GOSAR|nr:hypothetical protein PVK06_027501 [Gossypium arboreum]
MGIFLKLKGVLELLGFGVAYWMIKINADGGFSHNDRAGGIGVLCKSSEGSFFVGFGDTVSADSPKVVEGLALCKGAEVAAQKR